MTPRVSYFATLFLTLAFACFAEEILLMVDASQKIELLLEEPSLKTDRMIIFLHGAQDPGLKSISPTCFTHWLEKGYAVAAISMPGFGQSSGKRDFCGTFTIASLNWAIEWVKQRLSISSFSLIGFGQGGMAALLLATQRRDIRCIVCSNGGYDLLRHRNDFLFHTLKTKGYEIDCNDEHALMLRSPLYHVSDITTPLFLLHRKGNPLVSEQEAIDFHEAMLTARKECHLALKERTPGSDEQKLSYKEILEETEEWLESRF